MADPSTRMVRHRRDDHKRLTFNILEQEHILNTHIDTLKEWWENAEESDDFYPGDTWIKRRQAQTGGYVYDVGRVTSKRRYYEARVLARAPKPKPAWHDAVAVIARTGDFGHRRVFVRDGDGVWNDALSGRGIRTSGLRDVTPLIEAEVTDGMIDRILDVIDARFDNYPAGIGEELAAAALGLETA